MSPWWRTALVMPVLIVSCSRAPEPRRFELTGQILAVKPENREVLVKHDDIKGFMPAMTMPYKVRDSALLEGKSAGDLVTATLIVGETDAYLSAMTTTGHAPIETPSSPPEVSAFDILKEGDEVPDTPLVDEGGVRRPLSSYRGHRLALTFIYTRCPDAEFCPLMNQHFSALQRTIKATPELADARLASVTLDPAFDTPEVLKPYAASLQADPRVWHFLTGVPADLSTFTSRFGVTATSNGGPSIIHNLGTAVIDANGRLVRLYPSNQWTPDQLVADLKSTPAPPR